MVKISDRQMAEMMIHALPERERIALAASVMLSVKDPMEAGAVMRHSHEISRHADGLARSASDACTNVPNYPVTATPAFLPRGPAARRGTFPDGTPENAVPSGAFVHPIREWIDDALGVVCLFGLMWVLMFVAGVMQ